jgi:hypothetical protein
MINIASKQAYLMKKAIFLTISLILMLFFSTSTAKSQALIDLETGITSTGYNNVQIPGDAGTRFSFKKDLTGDAAFFYRIRLSYTFNKRHTLSVLYAPLKLRSDGNIPTEISFENKIFPANADLRGTYKFNSYRLTYRYELVRSKSVDFGLGITAKIRDASISLETPGIFSEKTNVGFVPLINFRMLWQVNDRYGILVDGDALAAKQGRAEDILIAATYKVSPALTLKAGYRLLEGGADNDEVYNYALFNYFSAGCFLRF